MITNPPPNDSAPTLNAVHARAPIPPTDNTAVGSTASEAGEPSPAAVDEQLEQAAGEQCQHDVGAQQHGGGRSDKQVGAPARGSRAAVADVFKARADQAAGGLDGDGGDRCSGARSGAVHPERRRVREEQQREREDREHRRHDEPEAADDRARGTGDPVGAEDR